MLGSFLAQLDATVVNVSLASLAAELHSTLAVIQWVTSGYLLALALMLPLNGWLVDRIGAKAVYLWCFSAFTISSAMCGLAWSANSLIAFRVLQGMSGGLLAPMAQMMIARAAGKHMARIIGYAALPVILAPLLGPVVAGAILQYASWRWLFLINLPVGVLAIVLAVLFLPNDREETRARELDLAGFALLSPGLVLFLYGSDHLGERIGLAVLPVSLVLLGLFVRMAQRKGANALIDLRLFRGKVFSASATTQFMSNGIAFAGQMLIPIYLIRACGRSPSATGWLLAPLGARDDVHLSLHGSTDQAVWHSQSLGWRRAGGVRRHAAISLSRQPRIGGGSAGRNTLHSRCGPERHRRPIDIGGVRIRAAGGPADGDDGAQCRAAARRPDTDHAVRDVSRLEIASGE